MIRQVRLSQLLVDVTVQVDLGTDYVIGSEASLLVLL